MECGQMRPPRRQINLRNVRSRGGDLWPLKSAKTTRNEAFAWIDRGKFSGPVGFRKTTLLNLVAEFLLPTADASGSLCIRGAELSPQLIYECGERDVVRQHACELLGIVERARKVSGVAAKRH